MGFLEEIVTNSELMFLYETISFLIGVILMFYDQRRKVLYNISIYSICFINVFFWGHCYFLE